jgi:PAS domain S-box-containing protein
VIVRPRSLRVKFLWGTICVIALVMATLIAVVDYRQHAAIVEEVERRGEVLARSLAASSQTPLLLFNFTALEQNVARVAAEADVVYAIVVDADGRVAAHSGHPDRVGVVLSDDLDRRAAAAIEPLTQERRRRSGLAIYDFSVPVIVDQHKWGTARVGLSRQRMEAQILRTRGELGALAIVTLLIGGGAAALVARRISRPVQQLAEGAAAIARGDLAQRIEPATADEIGRLAAAFNHMAAQLHEQRRALQDANAELRRRFEELADLKTYTDNVLASLTTGIVTVDLDGRVVTLNPAAELMTGFFAGEATGRYCTELFVATPELGEMLMETLASRIALPGVAVTLRRRNGRSVPVELSTAPLKGGEGKDLGVIGVFRDVTVVRQLEHRLRRSDRLAALGGLAAGLAHEIKNPLTSLLTFSRHLDRKFDDEHFRAKFQAVVPRELERINGIVERLLELARPSRLTFSPLRLPAQLERVLELYANQIEVKAIRVDRQYAAGVGTVWGDQDALYRALVNLVANALDAMERGGRLTLRLGWADGEEVVIAGRRTSANRRVKIEVEDTGCGIPASSIDRVFNPFFSTKDGGTGLGLALTHKIVEDHGGAIDVRSAPQAGTTFRIVLPLTPDPPPDPALHDDDELR